MTGFLGSQDFSLLGIQRKNGSMASDETAYTARPRPQYDAGEMEGVRARDPEALGRFFDLHFGLVYRFCHRMLGDWAMAEDVTQEVFLKVWKVADRLDAARDPAPFLLTIALRKSQSYLRSRAHRARQRWGTIQDSAEGQPATAGGPEKDVLSSESQRLVQEALLALPTKFRAVIVLHDFHKLSHEQIAKTMDLSHAAVRKRHSRALAALAKILKGRLQ